ncbi:MAG: hypothetical protein O2856_03650 [Planctomycetota bacterium]|nr:hypothetical protein [Planctomycetota bacterium]
MTPGHDYDSSLDRREKFCEYREKHIRFDSSIRCSGYFYFALAVRNTPSILPFRRWVPIILTGVFLVLVGLRVAQVINLRSVGDAGYF